MELNCDVLVIGGGTGGVAAAIAAHDVGASVILTEETDWLGGQLTSQAIPPDEHPWIEEFGCTRRYREYRLHVRRYYRDNLPLTASARANPRLNPGGGWVSKLCHDPRVGVWAIDRMLDPEIQVHLRSVPAAAEVVDDRVKAVEFLNLDSQERFTVRPRMVVDATEIGDLAPLIGAEWVGGAESRSETGEAHAPEIAQPENWQAITWAFAMAHDDGSHRVIDRPDSYDRWRAYQPDFWPGPLLGFTDLHPWTNQPRWLPLYPKQDEVSLFAYRQVVDPSLYESTQPHPVTIVNWPMNDYFIEPAIVVGETDCAYGGVPFARGPKSLAALQDAKELSRCLLYWLQTEAPRHDGGNGYPGLYLAADLTGDGEGFAKAAYIREARRYRTLTQIREQDIATDSHPGRDRAPSFPDSVGIGQYRIDLHPSTGGDAYIDVGALPFEIPFGALVPQRIRNVLAGGKTMGSTHISNGCYRLHPVEWNVGEAAGYAAAFAIRSGSDPADIAAKPELFSDFSRLLDGFGVERRWPETGL